MILYAGKPGRVLVVEDEMMVAMMIEDMLTDMGHQVVGPAMRIETALRLAREEDLDFAVLDVNLGPVKSFAVAEILRERGIPFIFATGYGRKGLNDLYDHVVVIDKPFEPRTLERAMASACP